MPLPSIPLCSFPVYDADSFALARFLLPMRAASANTSSTSSPPGLSSAVPAAPPPPAGAPGRWTLAEDLSGLRDMATMFERMQHMYNIYVLYYMLQGVILIGLMIRLLMYISFQKRLSVIGGTIARSLPDLLHFGVVVGIVCCMLAVFCQTVFGYRLVPDSQDSRLVDTSSAAPPTSPKEERTNPRQPMRPAALFSHTNSVFNHAVFFDHFPLRIEAVSTLGQAMYTMFVYFFLHDDSNIYVVSGRDGCLPCGAHSACTQL